SVLFFFSSRRRHTRFSRDWSSDVCSSDLDEGGFVELALARAEAAGRRERRRDIDVMVAIGGAGVEDERITVGQSDRQGLLGDARMRQPYRPTLTNCSSQFSTTCTWPRSVEDGGVAMTRKRELASTS